MLGRVLRAAGLGAGKQLLPGLQAGAGYERVVGLKQNAASSDTAEVELTQPLNHILLRAMTAAKTDPASCTHVPGLSCHITPRKSVSCSLRVKQLVSEETLGISWCAGECWRWGEAQPSLFCRGRSPGALCCRCLLALPRFQQLRAGSCCDGTPQFCLLGASFVL